MSLENDFFWNTTQQVGRPWRGRLCSFFIELDAGAKQHGVDVLHQRQRQRGKNREKIVRPASRTTRCRAFHSARRTMGRTRESFLHRHPATIIGSVGEFLLPGTGKVPVLWVLVELGVGFPGLEAAGLHGSTSIFGG